jgi:hypothetical protein
MVGGTILLLLEGSHDSMRRCWEDLRAEEVLSFCAEEKWRKGIGCEQTTTRLMKAVGGGLSALMRFGRGGQESAAHPSDGEETCEHKRGEAPIRQTWGLATWRAWRERCIEGKVVGGEGRGK